MCHYVGFWQIGSHMSVASLLVLIVLCSWSMNWTSPELGDLMMNLVLTIITIIITIVTSTVRICRHWVNVITILVTFSKLL